MKNFLHNLLQKVWYDSRPSAVTSLLRILLFPFSVLYAIGSGRKQRSAKPEKLDVPVISIGNLTVGGTGKTPFVVEVNNLLREEGLSGVILTRGYGRSSQTPLVLDGDAERLPTPEEAGDEPLVLFRQCKGTPVLVGSDRLANFRNYAEKRKIGTRGKGQGARKEDVDFVLLDDGMQHHAMAKDLNICLIDGKRLLGNGFCLPAGPLREPLGTSQKPDIIIVTRFLKGMDTKEIETLFPDVPLIRTGFVIRDFTPLSGNASLETCPLPQSKVVLVSALGDNLQFRMAVVMAGFSIEKHFAFSDHHKYASIEIAEIEKWVEESSESRTIVTTWKDAVKLGKWIKPTGESNIKWYASNISVSYEDDGKAELRRILMKAVQ